MLLSKRVSGVQRPAGRRGAARVVCSASRPTWLPNLTPPSHLKGQLAGDFGFDPLGLGQDPNRLKW